MLGPRVASGGIGGAESEGLGGDGRSAFGLMGGTGGMCPAGWFDDFVVMSEGHTQAEVSMGTQWIGVSPEVVGHRNELGELRSMHAEVTTVASAGPLLPPDALSEHLRGIGSWSTSCAMLANLLNHDPVRAGPRRHHDEGRGS